MLQGAAKRARATAARKGTAAGPVTATLPPISALRVDPGEQRERQNRVVRLVDESGVPPRYRKDRASLTNLDGVPSDVRGAYADAAARVGRMLREPGLLALLGPRGPGKTWLGCAAVLDCCRAGMLAVYLDAMDYFIALKETYGDRGGRESIVERRYLTPTLLVLDEMHERGDTKWEDRMLTRLVNKRYAADLATILISNDGREAFTDRIGPSIADRFFDGGDIIDCDWGSLRGRIRREGVTP